MPATYTSAIDGLSTSVAIKAPVRVATTANITLYGEQTINSIAVVSGDRVLVKDQTDQTQNGIYVASATTWTRAKDFDGSRDVVKGTEVRVSTDDFTTGLTYLVTTNNPIVIGTSNIVFDESGPFMGTSLDGGLVTDGGVQTAIETAIARRGVEVASVAALYGGDWSQYDYLETQAFTAGGSVGGAKWYKGTSGGTPTTPGTLYADLVQNRYVVDSAGNYWHIIDKPETITTLAGLKAYPVGILKVVYQDLVYVWTEGDYSSEITADNVGYYIKSDDYASTVGAWVADHSNGLDASKFDLANTPDNLSKAIALSKVIGFVAIDLPAWTITLTSELPAVNTSFNTMIIRGQGIDKTTLDISGLAAGSKGFKADGGSGTSHCGGYVCDLTINGDGSTHIGRENKGLGGWNFYRVRYQNLLHATVWSNDGSGYFTELSKDIDCAIESSVVQPWLYKRGAGNDSFHGSGFLQCKVNNDTANTNPTVQVGDTADAGRLVVYNAPWDAIIWTRSTYNVINVKTGLSSIVCTHGTLNFELFSGTPTLAAGDIDVNYAGNIGVWSSGIKLGKLVQLDWYSVNSDGSVNAQIKPRRYSDTNSSGTTIDLFTATDIGDLCLVNFVGANYDYKYLLVVEKDSYGGAGSATIIATINSFNTSGWGAPTITVSTSGLVTATNANWSGQTVTMYVHRFGSGGRTPFFSNMVE